MLVFVKHPRLAYCCRAACSVFQSVNQSYSYRTMRVARHEQLFRPLLTSLTVHYSINTSLSIHKTFLYLT